MKKIVAMICILLSVQTFSQTDKNNIVKSNVTAYAFRNINLTYERVLSKRFSITAGFGTMPKGSIPFASTYLKDTEVKDPQVALTNFTVETRIYLGEGYGKGFYIAPYYRYTSVNAENATITMDYTTTPDPTKISGKATGNSAGLLLGAQWFFGSSKNWVVDWWIIGGHYGAGSGDFRANSSRPLTAQEQQELKKEIDDLNIPMVKYTTTTDANGADVKMDGPWAGFRSGLSVGYRF